MVKKIVSVFIVIVLLIVLVFVLKNNIIKDTKNILNENLNTIYNYINKYNYDNKGVMNITANYKGAHGSLNPVNFEYNFNINYDNNNLYTTLENSEGYYTNVFNNNILSLYMKLKGNEQVKNIFTIKEIKEEFNKISFIFDESIINKVLNSDYKDFKLVINTNILYFGIKDYKLYLDNNILNITNDFKHISNDDIRISINNNGYIINYKDSIKVNYKNKEDNDNYNISINDLALNLELGTDIKVNINKEVSIYNGLDINISFKDVELNKNNEIKREEIPLFRYFDNVNIDLGE